MSLTHLKLEITNTVKLKFKMRKKKGPPFIVKNQMYLSNTDVIYFLFYSKYLLRRKKY